MAIIPPKKSGGYDPQLLYLPKFFWGGTVTKKKILIVVDKQSLEIQ